MALKSPCSEPIWEVLESLKTFDSIDDLGGVVTTEKGIWGLTHLLRGDGERYDGVVDDTVVLKRPKVVKLLLGHILMWRESKNTIRVLTKSLSLVKGKELEVGALVILELELDFDEALALGVEWLKASIILPYESLKLSRSVGQLA